MTPVPRPAPRPGLAEARKRAGYDQQGLADEVGVTKHTVSQWETGGESPHPRRRVRLALALGVSMDELHRLLNGEPLVPVTKQRIRVVFLDPKDLEGE
jgi:transcriptional regulator with XRE-family HTH domain